ncbi:hypothetical protein DES35_101784 [Schleiferia thermophila]|jgi:hypothetical protein|uniref:Uncharacterized protein n=1 Tax=Schleiferia thermophila TaxID=884107 RepID=A0A369ABN4_9FLAO|nr:hypothetical protein DES35_101784 [Schleiferia thermophila]
MKSDKILPAERYFRFFFLKKGFVSAQGFTKLDSPKYAMVPQNELQIISNSLMFSMAKVQEVFC